MLGDSTIYFPACGASCHVVSRLRTKYIQLGKEAYLMLQVSVSQEYATYYHIPCLTAVSVGDYVALYAMKSSHGEFFAAKVT